MLKGNILDKVLDTIKEIRGMEEIRGILMILRF